MSKINDLLNKPDNWLDDLLAEADAHFDSIEPVDVDVVFGNVAGVIRVPFIRPNEFSELADHHPPSRDVARDVALWFSLTGVTSSYPGIVLVVDGKEDDLYRVRSQEAVYIWPEMYAAMSPEDQQNVRMAVWALHIWEPQQRHQEALKKKEANHG